LDFCDHVILRSADDLELVQKRLGDTNVDVFPDITCILKYPGRQIRPIRYKIGVFLARPICSNKLGYDDMVKQIAEALDSIAETGFKIKLIPFNTDKSSKEDDRIINDQVFRLMKFKNFAKIVERSDWRFETMQEEISKIDYAICMRFHSHVFCTMNKIPFLSLCYSPKVS
jgi:polysaccharide pyruvyl transferase WcaK-like protein